jgi:hypothetical protein
MTNQGGLNAGYTAVYNVFGEVQAQGGPTSKYGWSADSGALSEGDAGLVGIDTNLDCFYDPKLGRSVNGCVDAADYVLWRRGGAVASLPHIWFRGGNSVFIGGENGTVPIELVSLSLVSCNPIPLDTWEHAWELPAVQLPAIQRGGGRALLPAVQLPAVQLPAVQSSPGRSPIGWLPYVPTVDRLSGGGARLSGVGPPSLVPDPGGKLIRRVNVLQGAIGLWPFWLPPW